MKKYSFCAAAALCATLVFTSCKDNKGENGDTPPPESGEFTVEAPGFNRWVYFSFEKGDTIETDGTYSALYNSKSWDMAFHRGDIRTNSGPSGPGQGGAFETASINMTTVAENPSEVTYTADLAAEIAFPTMQDKAAQSRNEVLATWYTGSGMPPSYTYSHKVFFVRTATGKYAKVQFTDYTNDMNKGGFVNFKYEYPVD